MPPSRHTYLQTRQQELGCHPRAGCSSEHLQPPTTAAGRTEGNLRGVRSPASPGQGVWDTAGHTADVGWEFGDGPAWPACTPAKGPRRTTFLLGFCEGGKGDLLVLSLTAAAGRKEIEEQARGRRSKPTSVTELISRACSA